MQQLTKRCSHCHEFKLFASFNRSKNTKDGRDNQCKSCKKEYYWCNRKKDLARSKVYRERPENKDRIRSRFQEWFAKSENRERIRLQRIKWREENPERHRELDRAYMQRRRARMYGTEPTLTDAEWQSRLEEFNYCCAYCLQPFDDLEMEHMQPISKGGLHILENVIPACRSCNATKGSNNLLEMLVTANYGREKLTSSGPLVEQLCQ